jgi:hypothetical protein
MQNLKSGGESSTVIASLPGTLEERRRGGSLKSEPWHIFHLIDARDDPWDAATYLSARNAGLK